MGHGLLRAGPAASGVPEELRAVLALDGRDGLLLGDGQGGDGCPLQQADVVGAQHPVAAERGEESVVEGTGDDADGGAVGGADPAWMPTGSFSVMSRPVRSKQSSASACSSSPSEPALARTRPSVVVTMAAPSRNRTSCSHRSTEPPARTICTRTRWTSSSRSSTEVW